MKKKEKRTFICLNCGKEQPLKKNSRGKYCDNKCQQEHFYKINIEKWKNGELDGMRGKYSISAFIRRYMLEKSNYRCSKCGWHEINPTTGLSPLTIHHIDGDYTNNKEDNLEVLCPNCHSLTPNYGSLNKKGRKGKPRN